MSEIIDVTLKDAPLYHSKHGDEMELDTFLSDCDKGTLSPADGFVGEILLENHVIAEGIFQTTDVNSQRNRSMLTNLQAEHGTLYTVWYDK